MSSLMEKSTADIDPAWVVPKVKDFESYTILDFPISAHKPR